MRVINTQIGKCRSGVLRTRKVQIVSEMEGLFKGMKKHVS